MTKKKSKNIYLTPIVSLILLTLILTILKSVGVSGLSWSLVFSPIWIPLSIVTGIIFTLILIHKITK